MSWLDHPRFRAVRDDVVSRLAASRDEQFTKVRPVVFLCGGAESTRRARLAEYIKRTEARPLVFYADDVWSLLARRPELNALQMERELAVLADLVIIVVESPGTFTELGAFAILEGLREKLLPILDRKYRGAESFITTGPVAWVNEDSKFGPAIWATFDAILDSVDDLDRRLALLPPPRSHRVENIPESPRHLVFFLADLAAVFGPCPAAHLRYYASTILGTTHVPHFDLLLNLAVAMDLIQILNLGQGADLLYYRPLDAGELRPFQERRYVDLARLRAQVLGVMLAIPSAAKALDKWVR